MRRTFRLALPALLLLLGACSNVAVYEKRNLGRRIMQFDANDLETSFENKVMFSREVSGGRPGHSAGGGCGCAN